MPHNFIDNSDPTFIFDPSSRSVDPTDLKIYRYIPREYADYSVPPKDVDFITGLTTRLHPTNSIIVDGEVRQTDYYASANPPDAYGNVSYSDLVVRESFVYTRDSIGFARARVNTITWYMENDNPHPDTKVRLKYYENDESLREGQRRRANITDKLSMDMSSWLIATQTQLPNPQDRLDLGRQFMALHKLNFDMYIEASSSQILYEVNSDTTTTWLDDELAPNVTIRATIIDALNIWNLVI